MKCMIVDDDLLSRKAIERLCQKITYLEVISICENADEALEALSRYKIELIFLDIHMPGLNGIDFMDHAGVLPQVILTTSTTDYAFTAFEYDVTDYLKKPIKFPRFSQAVEKARIKNLQQIHAPSSGRIQEVYLKENGRFIRVPYNDILYFENVGDYVKVKTLKDKHLIYGTLKHIEEKLNNPIFMKVHRSFIVNLSKIKDIEENTLVIDQKVIPISRSNKPLLMNKLNTL